jgi:hypothetical protein
MNGEPCNIREMAECHGWEEADHQPDNKMLSFCKNGTRINIYYSKMTVGICKNKRQYYFRRVTENELSNHFIKN